MAFSVSARAETVEEKKAAANYDETLPASEAAQALGEVPSVPQALADAPSATTVVSPVQEMSQAMPVPPGGSPVAATEVSPASSIGTAAGAEAAQEAALANAVGMKTDSSATVAPKAAAKDWPEAQVFEALKPSGLVEVSGYKYPVFLFAPKDYKTDRTYAMIMIAPAEDAKAEKQIEYLTGLAQRKSLFILAPYVLWPKEGDTPYRLDEWLLTVKKDMVKRFPINKKRIYLVGKALGAHYAAYMAIKYPQEFSAVALLGEAWDGPFSQLIDPRKDAADQVPFYIALKAGGDAKARNQVWLDELQKDGYPLHLVDYKNDEDLEELEFKKSVFDWMEATAQSWEISVAQGQKTWKGKFKKGVKDFFAV